MEMATSIAIRNSVKLSYKYDLVSESDNAPSSPASGLASTDYTEVGKIYDISLASSLCSCCSSRSSVRIIKVTDSVVPSSFTSILPRTATFTGKRCTEIQTIHSDIHSSALKFCDESTVDYVA